MKYYDHHCQYSSSKVTVNLTIRARGHFVTLIQMGKHLSLVWQAVAVLQWHVMTWHIQTQIYESLICAYSITSIYL